MEREGLTVIPDKYCPTFHTTAHTGWRGFLIYGRWPRLPKRWFKAEKQDRVFYKTDRWIICSAENYELIRSGWKLQSREVGDL